MLAAGAGDSLLRVILEAGNWRMRIFRKQYPVVAVFLLPGLLMYGYFFALPVLQTLWDSMFYWKGLSSSAAKEFVGAGNYIHLMTKDPYFWKAFGNTVYLMAGNLLIQVPLGFILALILNSGIRGKRFFNIAFFMPYVLSATSVALMWRFIYHPEGLINQFLETVGLQGLTTAWLANPSTNISAIVLVGVWQGAGFLMILFLAGLVNIPKEILESCRLEGAKPRQVVLQILIPMLWPVVITVITLVMINSVKSFDIIWILTRGGPFHSTEVLTTWMYQLGFNLSQPARGTAVASFIFLFVLFLSVFIRKFSVRDRIEY